MADIISTLGVSLILLAFLLVTLKKAVPTDRIYNIMNFFGAALAGVGAYMIHSVPFLVLESIWAAVAVYALIRNK